MKNKLNQSIFALLYVLLLSGCFLSGRDEEVPAPQPPVIEEEFGPMLELNDQYFLKRVKGNKWKLVMQNGEVVPGMVQHPGYDQILPFDRGFAPVKENEKWKLADKNGYILEGMTMHAGADVLFRCREISWMVRAPWCAKIGDHLGSLDKKGYFSTSYVLQPDALKTEVKKVVSQYGATTVTSAAIIGLVAAGGYGVASYVTYSNSQAALAAAASMAAKRAAEQALMTLHANFFRLYNFVVSPSVAPDFSCLICQQDHPEGVVESPVCGAHQQQHQAHVECLSEWIRRSPQNARCLMCYSDYRRVQ